VLDLLVANHILVAIVYGTSLPSQEVVFVEQPGDSIHFHEVLYVVFEGEPLQCEFEFIVAACASPEVATSRAAPLQAAAETDQKAKHQKREVVKAQLLPAVNVLIEGSLSSGERHLRVILRDGSGPIRRVCLTVQRCEHCAILGVLVVSSHHEADP